LFLLPKEPCMHGITHYQLLAPGKF
jgi:hypothetical protein